ncbi:MAG: hypothetical protein Q9194_003392 [Teloschistes cf. exilis]
MTFTKMSNQLDNPSQWTTGADPPTSKQKAFISTLASSKGVSDQVNPDEMNKSEASSKIEELKNQPTQNADAGAGQPIQNPDTWTTGDDKATGKQMGYVAVMAKKAGESVPDSMGKTEASKKIEELKEKTGM